MQKKKTCLMYSQILVLPYATHYTSTVYQENITTHVTVGIEQRAQENKTLSTVFCGLSRKKL